MTNETPKTITVEVADEEEGKLIQSGLLDAKLRAFLKVGATLNALESTESQENIVDAVSIILGIPLKRHR